MRLREKLLTSLLLVPIAGTSAWAKERSNYDAFLEQRDSRSLAVDSNTAVSRGLRIEQTEQRLGVPTFAWATQDGAQSKSVIRSGMTAEGAARAHLQAVADSYRLTRDDVAGASLRSMHNTGKGAIIATFNQSVGGIPVFRNEIKVVMGQDLRLVAVSGYLAPSELALTARAKARGGFNLGAADAVSGAFKDLTGSGTQATSFINAGTKGDYTFFELAPSAKSALPQDLAVPARARQVFFMLAGNLEPAWYVEVNAGPKAARSSQYFAYVVSAATGAVLFRNDLTADAGTAFTYKVWADQASPFIPEDGPQGNDATPHPTGTPNGYQAPLNRPAHDITLANSPYTKNDPWLPANATQTTGNNVDAYADLASPDGFQPGSADIRAETTSDNTFAYVYDTTKAPGSSPQQIKASVVNLFYVNNFLHDWFYDSGFDEAAGNAQSFNFGRGGVEGDPLQAQAQDYGGRNNANMSTPADGASPRMQMYVFDGTPELSVTAPASLAGVYEASSASFGSQAYDLTGDIQNAPAANLNGCVAFDAGFFTGKIALIDRGACDFNVKANNAQKAGAIATVIVNSVAGSPISMGGTNAAVNTPALMITQAAGAAWRTELANGPLTVKFLRAPDQDRDGTLDNGIIAHEWGHYISNRLVGNAAGLSNNQGRSMGEGWGDFHAMLMQVREADRTKPGNSNFQGVYSTAGYVTSGGKNQGYYYGIRRLPYSTNTAKNGYTFKHISNFVALPGELAASNPAINSEVHNAGEVWATALWECYASLLNAHPFQEAQDRMKRYLIAGYKATPNAPTFTEARDAVLAVAQASDPADYQRFVAAFAKRGMGFGAKSPDRNAFDHIGVVESFATGGNLEVTSITLTDNAGGCDQDGILDVGEQGQLKITVRNVGGNGLSAFSGTVSTSSTTASLQFPNGTTVNVPALSRGAQATVTLPVNVIAVSGAPARAGLKVVFDSNEIPAAAKTVTFDPRVNYDDVAATSNTETFESGLKGWTLSDTLSASGDFTLEGPVENRYAHGTDPSVATEITLTSPWMSVDEAADFTISYNYRHSFEYDYSSGGAYDGAVLEFTVDGIDWIDPWDLYPVVDADPGYTAYIEAGGLNPLEDRAAMALTSAGFPAFTSASINFADFFPSLGLKNVRFRFRVAGDVGVGGYGLDVDNVQFTGANPVFAGQPEQPASSGTCNLRPVANAGQSRVGTGAIKEGTLVNGVLTRATVTLNGTGSFDPDAAAGDALTYNWTQVGGATPVTLTNADTAAPSFVADVDYDDVLSFQLVVTDATGKASEPKTVDIELLNVNQTPVAAATAPATVNERDITPVTLDASASTDPDATDALGLTYAWVQTGGTPKVTLTNANKAKATFLAPEVTADAQLTFTVTVTDSSAAKSSKAVSVTVKNVDRAPVANAGADFAVDTRTPSALSGSGTDADGDAVTLAWEQVSGPAVVLTGANTATPTFTSPDVEFNTDLVFKLTATANGQSSSDTVTVTVKGVDRAPTANAGADITVDERAAVSLAGSGEDADGDALSYQWEQIAGTQVQLTGATTATLAFTAPEITATTTLIFKLTVTANGKSATDTVSVTVNTVDRAPVANAGADFTVDTRKQSALSGSGTDADGDAVTLAWEQVSGPAVILTGANTATPTFVSPDVEATTDLVFKLTATANGQSSSDTVTVTVKGVDRAPVANAGADITANERTAVSLAGTGTDAEGDALSYQWEQIAGTQVQLTGDTTTTPSFTAPDVTATTTLTFQLTVTANGKSSTDTVNVTVNNVDRAPVANAGADFEAGARDTVTLHGSGSDVDGDALSYFWTQTGGEAVTLNNADSASATFMAPDVKTPTELTFKLTVTANGVSTSDLVNVTVRKMNRHPVGQAPAAITVNEGEAVELDASGITDPDGDALTFTWTQVGGATVSTTGAGTAKLTFAAPQVQADTALAFSLTVTDSDGAASGPFVYTVNVKQVNQAPVAKVRVISGVRGGELVKIDASTSTDPDNETLTYTWQQTGGPSVTLSGANAAEASFTPPAKKTLENYTFKVTVTDAAGATSTADITVSVPKADDDGGGCSSTGGTAGSMAPLMALFAAMALSRRRKA
ncbi:myxosortase-dependent M36 family metallopeptidase [Corallococcus aberystwythensis]|uniref:Histidine kinase n=1 Tax=Corallococcus aberystwythensis TaxID=2316722 RepID=A0A3A8QM48_9BACT|nr:myxosortase-dependent M36 family metallopeptidase [Corallococcus aberystwythensis]RKH65932.1 histidine kinase [Corallococcus aberystwythensis]